MGKKKLEAAIQESQGQYEFIVRWQPFLLRTNIPPEGIPKPSATPNNPRVSTHLKKAGNDVGIEFTGKSEKYPNTVKAHVLLEMVTNNPEMQNQLVECLFKAYFTDGSVFEDNDLLDIAESVGLARSEAESTIQDISKQQDILQISNSWQEKGVTGVPAFFMNNHMTFTGAQEKDCFTKIFETIAAKYPQTSGL